MKHILIDSENDINADPKNPDGELLYLVTEIEPEEENEADVIQYIHDVSPTYLVFPVTNVGAILPNTLLDRIWRLSSRPRWHGTDCFVTVRYGRQDAAAAPAIGGANPSKNSNEGGTQPGELLGPEYNIRISGQTQHINVLDETMVGSSKLMERRHAFTWSPAGTQVAAPTLNGLIGIEDDKVVGVDVQRPKCAWSLTVKGLPITKNYRRYLRTMGYTVNSTKVFDAEIEELLFTECELSQRPGDGWVGIFHFEEGFNQSNVNIGGFNIPDLKAHDYVWCQYASKATSFQGGTALVRQPSHVYVDRLFPKADHAGLFVGVG